MLINFNENFEAIGSVYKNKEPLKKSGSLIYK